MQVNPMEMEISCLEERVLCSDIFGEIFRPSPLSLLPHSLFPDAFWPFIWKCFSPRLFFLR